MVPSFSPIPARDCLERGHHTTQVQHTSSIFRSRSALNFAGKSTPENLPENQLTPLEYSAQLQYRLCIGL